VAEAAAAQAGADADAAVAAEAAANVAAADEEFRTSIQASISEVQGVLSVAADFATGGRSQIETLSKSTDVKLTELVTLLHEKGESAFTTALDLWGKAGGRVYAAASEQQAAATALGQEAEQFAQQAIMLGKALAVSADGKASAMAELEWEDAEAALATALIAAVDDTVHSAEDSRLISDEATNAGKKLIEDGDENIRKVAGKVEADAMSAAEAIIHETSTMLTQLEAMVKGGYDQVAGFSDAKDAATAESFEEFKAGADATLKEVETMSGALKVVLDELEGKLDGARDNGGTVVRGLEGALNAELESAAGADGSSGDFLAGLGISLDSLGVTSEVVAWTCCVGLFLILLIGKLVGGGGDGGGDDER